MKILWFTWKDMANPIAGGAEVVNEELAKRLATDGHDVVFIVAGFPGGDRTAERDGYRIVRVGSRFTSYLAAFLEYRRNWKDWPDLVIDECNTMPYFASRYSKGRQVLFFHMLCREIWFYEFPPILSHLGYLAEPIYLRLLRRNIPIVTVSESAKQDLARMGFKKGLIHIISEGIQIQPVKDLSKITKYKAPTVLSLGSIRPMKRTLEQVQAFELAKMQLPELKMKIAGDATGDYGRKVLDYIKASGYAKDIDYVGRTSDEEKTELMQKSHLILVTSVKEGWGLIVTEAASQGTPAVVYDVDGLRDSVRNGETGLVTMTNTPAELAANINVLLSQPNLYAHMRASGWEWSNIITFERSYEQFKEALRL
jgi:glycosyltransferase involved in cell wall biosynthesis